MTNVPEVCLTADWILPLDQLPMRHGVMTIAENRITHLGQSGDPLPSVDACHPSRFKSRIDYRNCVVLPGLINAHTHLDLSGWSGSFVGQPKLWEWIPEIVRFRRSPNYRPAEAIRDGARAVIAGGAVAAVDVIPSDWLTWQEFIEDDKCTEQTETASPKCGLDGLRVLSLIECLAPTGVMRTPPEELLNRHQQACQRLKWSVGISPHAPYTVPLNILEELVELAVNRDLPLAMHIAETEEEITFLATGGGAFRDVLEQLSAYRGGVFTPGHALADVLEVLSRARKVLLIHGNYIGPSEVCSLKPFRDRMAVVYCPRSHDFFGHAPYPLELFLEASIPVLLGTDSRASHPDLSIFGDLQTVRRKHPQVAAETIVRMATSETARFFGWDRELGSIGVGRPATFTVIELSSRSQVENPYEALLSPEAQVRAVWIEGNIVFEKKN